MMQSLSLIHIYCCDSSGEVLNLYEIRKRIINDEEYFFSDKLNYNGETVSCLLYTSLPVVSIMAVSEEPDAALARTLRLYELLKENFMASHYLPVAAVAIAQLADNLGLVGEQVIVFCEAGAFRGEQLIAVISARQQGAQAVYFFFILEQGGIDAAVFGGH